MLRKLSDLLAHHRSTSSVLIGIILLTLPCYLVGGAALFIAQSRTAPPGAAATALTMTPAPLASPSLAAGNPPTQAASATDIPTLPPAQTDIPTSAILTAPQDGTQLPSITHVMGTATCKGFDFYKLNLWSLSNDICKPCVLPVTGNHTMVRDGTLFDWDTSGVLAGDYGLELVVVCYGTEQTPKPRVNVSIRH
jgi:hypothetical protein